MQLLHVVGFLLISGTLMAQTSDLSAEASGKFAKLSEGFIQETLALSPSSASQAGYHERVDPKTGKTVALDALLDDVNAAGS